MQLTVDPRRADRERKFKPPPPTSAPAEDLTTDYMNILGNNLRINPLVKYLDINIVLRALNGFFTIK